MLHVNDCETLTDADLLCALEASREDALRELHRRYAPALQAHMKRSLQKVAGIRKLSNDVREIVTKALAN